MSPKYLPDNVCRELSARMAQFAEQLGVPRDQREDVVQEAWVHAFLHDKAFYGEHALEELCAWLCVIVHNVAVDVFRGLGRHSTASLEALSAEPMDGEAANRADLAEQMECLSVYVGRLHREEPENGRLVCEHCLSGRTIRELAEETDWTANEISCRIYRSVQKMRSWASELCSHGEGVS